MTHEDVERFQRLLDRRERVEAVDLVEVDVIELQPLQARLRLVEDVVARCAALVRPVAHGAEDLGGHHDLIARHADILQRLAGDLLRQAPGVDVRRVEKVDARIEGGAQELVGLLLLDGADVAPDAFAAAERHRAEAQFGDEEAGLSERIVTHV